MFRKTVGIFIIKNDWFRLVLLMLLTREKFKRGNVMEKKVEERRVWKKNQEWDCRSDEQMVRDRSHSIPTNSSFVYRGKASGIERKGSQTLLDDKSNVTDSE